MVLGVEEALALAEAHDIAALLLLRDENATMIERRTTLFPDPIERNTGEN
jgi:hypothetical protein